jgi:hypothetical protein
LLTTHAISAIITITLDGVSVSSCDEIWTESGVELSFVETTGEDCDGGGNCSFGTVADRVWLFPARLNLDLSILTQRVTSAEVDIDDSCGVACSRAFLYEGNSTVDSDSNTMRGTETLDLSADGSRPDRLAVSSCEGAVSEIRLEVVPIPSAILLFSSGLFCLAGFRRMFGS